MPHASLPPLPGRRLVFLHLPKTGGTTLDHHFAQGFAPGEICPEHGPGLHRMPAEELARYRYFSGHFVYDQLRCIPGPLFTVTVLRNPVERLLSAYYFLKRHRPEHLTAHPMREAEIARQCPDLLAFLRRPEPEIRYYIDNTMARNLAGGVNLAEDGGYVFPAGGSGVPISELEIMHRATGNLMAVDVVGFTHNLGQVYARVALALGLPQQVTLARLNARRDVTASLAEIAEEAVTEEARKELNRLTSLDRELFRLARAHAALRR